jgi:hypothetical protein
MMNRVWGAPAQTHADPVDRGVAPFEPVTCRSPGSRESSQFQHGDAGQMTFYLNYWKREMTGPTDGPPVGLLLCCDKDQTKVECAIGGLDQQLFVSRYLVALPKPTEIERLIQRDRALWEQRRATNTGPIPI